MNVGRGLESVTENNIKKNYVGTILVKSFLSYELSKLSRDISLTI